VPSQAPEAEEPSLNIEYQVSAPSPKVKEVLEGRGASFVEEED